MMSPENIGRNNNLENVEQQKSVFSLSKEENIERVELGLKKLDGPLTDKEEERLKELQDKKELLKKELLKNKIDNGEAFDKALGMEQRDSQSRNG